MSVQSTACRTAPHPAPVRRMPSRMIGRAVFETISGKGLEQRLFARAEDSVRGATLSDARVLLVGFSSAQLASMREHLRAFGVRATASAPGVSQLANVIGMKGAFSHIIVNFDAFEDVETGVDCLLSFRKQTRDFVVIACSAAVAGDDFGSERSAICDATLRMPVSRAALRAGLGG